MTDRVCVLLGAGGIGSWLAVWIALFLRNCKEPSRLVIVDGGYYRLSQRDHERFTQVGRKADRTREALSRDYPHLRIQSVNQYVGIADEGEFRAVERVIPDGAIVLVAVDNLGCVRLVDNHAQTLHNVTVIRGATKDTLGLVQVCVRRDGHNLTPPLSYGHPDIEDADVTDARGRNAECGVWAGANTMMTTAMYMANAFYHALGADGQRGVFPYRELYIDTATGKTRPTPTRTEDLAEAHQ